MHFQVLFIFLSLGQFWNVHVSMTLYDGPLRPGYEQFFNREKLYLVTVTQVGGDTRSFLGEMHHTTWDRRSGEIRAVTIYHSSQGSIDKYKISPYVLMHSYNLCYSPCRSMLLCWRLSGWKNSWKGGKWIFNWGSLHWLPSRGSIRWRVCLLSFWERQVHSDCLN